VTTLYHLPHSPELVSADFYSIPATEINTKVTETYLFGPNDIIQECYGRAEKASTKRLTETFFLNTFTVAGQKCIFAQGARGGRGGGGGAF
jgi:hypothetical protein